MMAAVCMPAVEAPTPCALNSTVLVAKAKSKHRSEIHLLQRHLVSAGSGKGRGVENIGTQLPPALRLIEHKTAPKHTYTRQEAAIAVYWGHDANIALSVNGQIQCTLAMERLFRVRYYSGVIEPNTS